MVIKILNKTQVNQWSLSGFRRVVAVQLAQNACKPINKIAFCRFEQQALRPIPGSW
jgi:hypothetical protein